MGNSYVMFYTWECKCGFWFYLGLYGGSKLKITIFSYFFQQVEL